MKVADIYERVGRWVDANAAGEEGFLGAHILGSLNRLGPGDDAAPHLDVDLALVFDREPGDDPVDLPYPGLLKNNDEIDHGGIILEAVHLSASIYADGAAICANPVLAHHLRPGSVLRDPAGFLAPRAAEAEAGFARRSAAAARVGYEAQLAAGSLQQAGAAPDRGQAAFALAWTGIFAAGMLVEACLRMPTHRRGLCALHEALKEVAPDRLPAHAELLAWLGYDRLDRAAVEQHLADLAATFDRAAAVQRGNVPFSFKLTPHVRPIFIEGCQEMITEGFHREALFWITAALFVANLACQVDGPEEERALHQGRLEALLDALGLADEAAVRGRVEAGKSLLGSAGETARAILAQNPGVVD